MAAGYRLVPWRKLDKGLEQECDLTGSACQVLCAGDFGRAPATKASYRSGTSLKTWKISPVDLETATGPQLNLVFDLLIENIRLDLTPCLKVDGCRRRITAKQTGVKKRYSVGQL